MGKIVRKTGAQALANCLLFDLVLFVLRLEHSVLESFTSANVKPIVKLCQIHGDTET
jgi:hypothetical protein